LAERTRSNQRNKTFDRLINYRGEPMKNLTLLLLAVSLFFSCEKTEKLQGDEYFIFGTYNGFCVQNCTTLFKLEGGHLFADKMDKFIPGDELQFEENALSEDKFKLASDVFVDLPDKLQDTLEKSFGCPGCVDQDIILLVYFDGSDRMEWTVDTDIEMLPDYLQDYAQEIQDLVLVLVE